MVVVQFVIEFKGNDQNTIGLHLLEREDANEQERELARNIQGLHLTILEELRDQLPAGEISIKTSGAADWEFAHAPEPEPEPDEGSNQEDEVEDNDYEDAVIASQDGAFRAV